MNPTFLELGEVLDIHQDQINRYGGSLGIREMGLLQSALATPAAGFGDQFLHADLYEMAAAYLFHLVQNHPFVDGNKRTGAVACFIFLRLNGITLTSSEEKYETLVLSVSKGKSTKAQVAEFLRKNSHS